MGPHGVRWEGNFFPQDFIRLETVVELTLRGLEGVGGVMWIFDHILVPSPYLKATCVFTQV